jgi:flagellar motility protein MotE (MotC chaperone)
MDNAPTISGAPGEQPTTETVTNTPAERLSEQPASNAGITSQLAALGSDDLKAIINGIEPTGHQVEPNTTPTETQTAPVQVEPTSDEPEYIEPEPGSVNDDGTPQSKELKRISVRGIDPEQQKIVVQAVDMVRKGEAPDLASAVATLTAAVTPPASASTEPPPNTEQATPAPIVHTEASAEVSQLETRLAELHDTMRQAREDFDNVEVDRLQREITDVNRRLAVAEVRAEQQQAQAQQAYAQFDANVAKTEAKYPDMTKSDTPFFKVLNDKVIAMQARQKQAGLPPLEIVDPGYIERAADEVYSLLNSGKPKEPSAEIPPKPVTNGRPVGSTVAPGVTAARPTQDQMRSLIKSAKPDEIAAALFTT